MGRLGKRQKKKKKQRMQGQTERDRAIVNGAETQIKTDEQIEQTKKKKDQTKVIQNEKSKTKK